MKTANATKTLRVLARTSFALTPKQRAWLEKIAGRDNVSMSAKMREILDMAMGAR